MKKILKVLVPILLVVALLVGGYWFFFRYRPDLTTGLLRELAKSSLTQGRTSTAIRFYGWAHDLAPGDASLSLELAEAYRQSGNYTKTEYVLVHGIYEAPEDPRLYAALSQVYVEQDKLLDAQQMLDAISNPEAKAALDRLRPQAPTASPEGAYYSEYITVALSLSGDGACYYTVDGTYPTLAEDSYTEPFTLVGGDTTVCAVAVSPDGLVSPVLYEDYNIAGVVEDVTFHDEALKTTVQDLLHRGNRTIQTDDLWSLEELTLPEGITNTEDLALFTGMTKLVGYNLGELDYSFLSSMPELRYLELEGCALTTQALEQIGACQSLDVLILASCGLSNIEPLKNLTGLRVLDLTDNSVNTMTPLSSLAALDELYLGHNAITTLPGLRGMKTLRILDLSYNALDYVGALSTCPTIQRLNLSHNKITTVTAVGFLTELVWFNGSNNEVKDVSALKSCSKLESFVMTDNKLTTIDFMDDIPTLREVNIDYNDVTAVPHFPADCPLENFSAAHNFLEDLSGLGGLPHLAYVNADYNNIRDISVLKDCPELAQVNVYGTYIRSAGVLGDKGVVVNFTPGF